MDGGNTQSTSYSSVKPLLRDLCRCTAVKQQLLGRAGLSSTSVSS